MATVNTGYTWASGNTVSAGLLNQSVNSATVSGIVNADIDAEAAIDPSKLGTGALPAGITVSSTNIVDGTIVNADINTSAAIAYSKLNLSNSIVAGDIASSAITATKLNGAQTGSAPIYGCRAWVNFDGTKDTTGAASTANTNRQIRASGNVSGVLRNGAGDYTITFTTAMPDANYITIGAASSSAGEGMTVNAPHSTAPTTSSVRILLKSPGISAGDREYVSVHVLR